MTFEEFLLWAQADGINAIIGFLWSFIVIPKWEWYKSKDEWTQAFVTMLATVSIPAIAAGVAVAMGYQAFDFESTFWPAIRAGFIAFTTSYATRASKEKSGQKIAEMRLRAAAKSEMES